VKPNYLVGDRNPSVSEMRIYGSEYRSSEDFEYPKEPVSRVIILFSFLGALLMILGGITGLLYATDPPLSFVETFGRNVVSRAVDSMIHMWTDGIDWVGLDATDQGVLLLMSWTGLAAGITEMGFTVMLALKPGQRVAWGILIVAASVASFAGLAGFVVGAVFGITGGFLAMS
jgi:hypothetical protein